MQGTRMVETAQQQKSWLDRLLASIAEHGFRFVAQPNGDLSAREQAELLADALLGGRGEASGAALATALLDALRGMPAPDRLRFFQFLAESFLPDPNRLADASRAYLDDPGPETAGQLAEAAEPPRQELFRRMNQAPGGTAALIGMRAELVHALREHPELKPLDADLKHLLTSWFNRGFLELRRIDWRTPAFILEKLIEYEAVHEIDGWGDLRRRLAGDRRCFGFFHPSLPDEPLIFVEVALVKGLASAIGPLLAARDDNHAPAEAAYLADTAIFYSISNCQEGLKGISFGNFLIKQVVEELRQELPRLKRFATISPLPGLARVAKIALDEPTAAPSGGWLLAEEREHIEAALGAEAAAAAVQDEDGTKAGRRRDAALLQAALAQESWWTQDDLAASLRAPVLRLAALYLTGALRTGKLAEKIRTDPVAKFHLGNGARLERIHFLANTAPRGIRESFGVMVNYLYDPEAIEARHGAFVRDGTVARSSAVDHIRGGPGLRWFSRRRTSAAA